VTEFTFENALNPSLTLNFALSQQPCPCLHVHAFTSS